MSIVLEDITTKRLLGFVCAVQATLIGVLFVILYQSLSSDWMTNQDLLDHIKAIDTSVQQNAHAINGVSIISSIQAGQNTMFDERIKSVFVQLDEIREHVGMGPREVPVVIRRDQGD